MIPDLPLPAGLPIGDGWVPAATADVVFPYDGSVVRPRSSRVGWHQ